MLLTAMLAAPAAAENRIDLVRPDAPELAARGESPVGVRTLTLTDPGRVDVRGSADAVATRDRSLTVELWYPAAAPGPGGVYATVLRDGETPVILTGSATRDAAPAPGVAPLVILSHGYPGNRFLMAHLGEHLASRGYAVASIDHADSTYDDLGVFGSTLYNRPLDQAFVLDRLAAEPGIDASRAGLIGYSMGGYGALILAGAGVSAAAPDLPFAPPQGLLAAHRAGSETHEGLMDPRLAAVIAIGPWGRNAGIWDDAGLAGLRVPVLIMAGSADTVSGYDAMRAIFAGATGIDRALLTFENAGHNAAAPIPAPAESWAVSAKLGWAPHAHYADAVWDSVRMNNIAQHFATAFLDANLRQDADKRAYLDLIPRGAEGVWSVENGAETPAHTYWRGFPAGTAVGLAFETRSAD